MKILLLVFSLVTILPACSTKNEDPAMVGDELVWSTDSSRPEWVYQPQGRDGDRYLFSGQSFFHATERSAEESAYSNALNKVVKHTRQQAKATFEETVEGSNTDGDVQSQRVKSKSQIQTEAIGIVNDIQTIDLYTEQWSSKEKGLYFRSYVLVAISDETYQRLSTQQ